MRRIGLWCALGVLGLVLVGGLIAYVWLPQAARAPGQTLFGAWCSAWGVPRSWATSREAVPANPSSEVVLTHNLLAKPEKSDIGHGATLALRCGMCHGPTGITFPDAPNLAGQYAAVVYKELRDYKSGIRTNAIMTAMVAALSDDEMRELAAYYASLPRPQESLLQGGAPKIVKWGAPMRNIPPCGSCHGDIDHTMASPWLEGEPRDYIRAQLTAFASEDRHNDINGQMRAVAHALSAQEIAQAAAYYSSARR